ncbi:unnamed protein product [Allacma fusca]|uniref:Suppressor of cytokine signaling 7 n=1 Tax=Allacma fusca TaxID=39272 RepID=A0A8J2NJT5_9HEXA|nr:unnamed protein product [Allacma fusca]
MSSGTKEIFDSSHSRVKTVVVRKKSLTKAQNRSSCESYTKKNLEPHNSTDDVDVCYNVPFQCDIYSLPIDSISPQDVNKPTTRRSLKNLSKRGGNNSGNENCQGKILDEENLHRGSHRNKEKQRFHPSRKNKPAAEELGKKINPSSRLSERNNNENAAGDKMRWSKKRRSRSVDIDNQNTLNQRKLVQSSEAQSSQLGEFSSSKGKRNFGHTLLNLFRRNRQKSKTVQLPNNNDPKLDIDREVGLVSRALPPPPPPDSVENPMADNKSPVEPRDFAASIEKVKDCGWYWGPLASDEAEDLLRGEPDGSFIVRDSSDAHYIFSLTFKLNGLVRHVRIEHDQGNFSFGPLTRFKAATIVEFVEKAVAHSRSGRYLFFLHRRPVLGPMQVQLLHPYSRFRHPRSLQHMCRFVILKFVRRDLLNTLPLPKPLQDYLNTPHYYFEQQELSSKNT